MSFTVFFSYGIVDAAGNGECISKNELVASLAELPHMIAERYGSLPAGAKDVYLRVRDNNDEANIQNEGMPLPAPRQTRFRSSRSFGDEDNW